MGLLATLTSAPFLTGLIKGHLLLAYGLIFLLSIPEGPILTVLCGFLTTQGLLNAPLIYVLVVLGDMVGDSLHYGFGRFFFSGPLKGSRHYFEGRPFAALATSKLVHGPGVIGLIMAGAVEMPYRTFVSGCLLVTLAQSLVLLTLGRISGGAYERVTHYLNIYAAIAFAAVFAVIVYIGLRRLVARCKPQLGS